MSKTITPKEMKQAITNKLLRHFSKQPSEATPHQFYEACALVLRDKLSDNLMKSQNRAQNSGGRKVHYLCMEFLIGRSFLNNAYNLGVLNVMREALAEMGVNLTDLFEQEDDPGLGNGGLGRLAACYMDAMATLGVNGSGYSIRYAHGIFKQKIIDGKQVEIPDSWLASGDVWQISSTDDAREVRIGGKLETYWDNGKFVVHYKDYDTIIATPYDMPISGYRTDNITRLRLWEAKSPEAMDYDLFSRGQYLKALEKQAMAEVISMVLYPEDNHYEGQSLRLKQQYFLVSATIQDICAKHKAKSGTLKNFAHYHVIHINDTHPTMVIPEMMRIFMDEEDMGWEEAWNIVQQSVAYTNHTVMTEALECWPCDLVHSLVPRIYQIIEEIDRRFCEEIWKFYPNKPRTVENMRIIGGGRVRMANLAIIGSFSVNGVSELHSDILKNKVFSDFYHVYPAKFRNVTNGIAHRRWLCEANPQLTELISSLIGRGFRTHPSELMVLRRYEEDDKVLDKLGRIKRNNKKVLANYIQKYNGITVNLDSIFDIQVKRLHEYKRQLLNVMHILCLYHRLKENPQMDFVPRTFIFGSKAAPGYVVAKRIIQLINSVADLINRDPDIGDKIKVIFIEDYKVSLAEIIMPAADISEQISTAGKEASGTGNMKLMMNGALTIGTMDGANVEICEAVGEDNIFIFGLRADEVQDLSESDKYHPMELYRKDPRISWVLNRMRDGFPDGNQYEDLVNSLLQKDPYMLLMDFDSYAKAQRRAAKAYRDTRRWNRMVLRNIACSGRFAADRSIAEYAQDIWKVKTNFVY